MAKCKACGKFLSSIDAAKCGKCSNQYHKACVGLSAKAKISTTWSCPYCDGNSKIMNESPDDLNFQGKSQNSGDVGNIVPQLFSTPVAPQEIENHEFNLRTELRLATEEIMENMRREFRLLREDMGQRISDLEKRVSALEESKQLQACPPSDINDLINQLKNDINDRDQELLLNDVSITNLPEVNGENPIHIVLLVASKIGLNIDERDIVSAERIGARRINATEPVSTPGLLPIRPRRLVVRLTRRDLRDQMLACARSRRGVTSADLNLPGASLRFYVNEHLTKQNRVLFQQAREAGSRLGWKYVWTKRGRILARQRPGDAACFIRNEGDLLRVFGTSSRLSEQTNA